MKKSLFFVAFWVICFNLYAFLPVAKVVEVKGKVKLNSEMIKIGTEIAEGNQIQLKRGERLKIEFQNGHKVSLHNANVTFETLNPKNTLVNLDRGSMLVEINSLSANENFNVRAKNIQVAPDVSTFFMDQNGKKIRLTVASGKVQVQRLKETMDLGSLEEATFDQSPRFEKVKIKESQFKRAKRIFN